MLDYHDAAHFREYETTVSSKRTKCLAQRKVVVLEMFAGGNEKVLDAKTDDTGYAYADRSGFSFEPNEVFFAKVRERQVGGLKCRATESDPVVFEG